MQTYVRKSFSMERFRWNVAFDECGGAARSTGRANDVDRFAHPEWHCPHRERYIASAGVELFARELSSVRCRTERSGVAGRGSDSKFSGCDSGARYRDDHEPTRFGWRFGRKGRSWALQPKIRSSSRLSVSFRNLHDEPLALRRCLSPLISGGCRLRRTQLV